MLPTLETCRFAGTALHLLQVRREISLRAAARLSGPEVGGTRPVVVTFEEFRDREEVLRKAGLLKGGPLRLAVVETITE